ncbi:MULTISPECIES: lysine exporter LysO family protein [unclassified Muribaculum]|uniref:lysine exporter LysO family protein n=1 Tax=unclassified Muribaculum TaxID=2622126 RepID=UPI001EF4BB97|nr:MULTISPECIES: lysine exporter LysO family protein [unclassified Muribaculum]
MFVPITIMLIAAVAGFLLRKVEAVHRCGSAIKYMVWFLLFVLGLSAGMNDDIVYGFAQVGLVAFIFAFFGTAGAMIAAWAVYRLFFKSRETEGSSGGERAKGGLKGSFVIIVFFAAGLAAGILKFFPESFPVGEVSKWALYLLLFFVGLSVGSDSRFSEIIRTMRPKLLLIPLATIVGTLSFSALAAWLIGLSGMAAGMPCGMPACVTGGLSVPDGLAVGSGFTYYSLSSVLITQLKAPLVGAAAAAWLGTVALLTNLFKEIAVLVGAPLMTRLAGPFAPICVGGAASMDVLLPSITSASGRQWAFVAVLHGAVIDFCVPFFVSFFCAV